MYSEVCKSSSEYGVELQITIFQRSLLNFFVLSFALFLEDRKYFLCSVLLVSIGRSQHIAAQTSKKFNMRYFVASTQAFIARAEIACEK